jgi:hypothetical protein
LAGKGLPCTRESVAAFARAAASEVSSGTVIDDQDLDVLERLAQT